jgi:hypothetical protein
VAGKSTWLRLEAFPAALPSAAADGTPDSPLQRRTRRSCAGPFSEVDHTREEWEANEDGYHGKLQPAGNNPVTGIRR